MLAEVKIENKEGWKGTVTLTVPPAHKRTMILIKTRVRELKTSDKIKKLRTAAERDLAGERNIEIMGEVYEKIREFIEEVDLVGPEGKKCTSLEQMDHEPGLELVFVDLAGKFCEGFGPGKSKSP